MICTENWLTNALKGMGLPVRFLDS